MGVARIYNLDRRHVLAGERRDLRAASRQLGIAVYSTRAGASSDTGRTLIENGTVTSARIRQRSASQNRGQCWVCYGRESGAITVQVRWDGTISHPTGDRGSSIVPVRSNTPKIAEFDRAGLGAVGALDHDIDLVVGRDTNKLLPGNRRHQCHREL